MLTLIGAVLLAILVGPAPSVAIAVHAGYITVQYMVMGLVLGLWR